MRRLLVLLFLPLFFLTVACGGDSDSKDSKKEDSKSDSKQKDTPPKIDPAGDNKALDRIKVTGETTAKPKVDLGKGAFKVKQTSARVLKKGTGPAITSGEQAEVQYLGLNGRDAKEFDTSWKKGAKPLGFTVDPKQMIKGFVRGIVGKPVGSRVLIAIPPADGYGAQGNQQAGILGTDTLVFVVDITSSTAKEKKELAKLEPGSLDDVKVAGKEGAKPKVSFKAPLRLDKSAKKVLTPGTGKELKSGERAIVDYVGVNSRTGEEFDGSSWKSTEPVAFTLAKDQLMKGFYDGLIGQKVGSRVLLAMPPSAGFGEAGNAQAGIRGTDSLVFVVEIKAALKPVTKASGSKVTPPKTLPAVTVDKAKGYPTKITIPKGAKAPTKLVAQPLIKGKGAKISKDQSVATVHYSAFNWRGGKLFDTSFEGRPDPMTGQPGAPQPMDVPLAGYRIPGLSKALVGQTVGSRVLVVLPPAEGFKESGGLQTVDVKPTDTTVFVVDILGVG